MTTAYVDTDLIVRLITGDDPAKLDAAQRLFASVEDGQVTVRCPITVIADAVFVLTSRRLYALDRSTVASALDALITLPHFQVTQKAVVRRALELFAETNLDFGDALLVADMEANDAITLYSYDRDFDRIPRVKRVEP